MTRYRDDQGHELTLDPEQILERKGESATITLVTGHRIIVLCEQGSSFNRDPVGITVTTGPIIGAEPRRDKIFYPWSSVLEFRIFDDVRHFLEKHPVDEDHGGRAEYEQIFPILEEDKIEKTLEEDGLVIASG